VLELCRRLLAAGYDPATLLLAYRGDMLCLIVRSIGEAAGLEINGDGTGFRRCRKPDAASPIAQKRAAYAEVPSHTGHASGVIGAGLEQIAVGRCAS
jgi:hypothetical protein